MSSPQQVPFYIIHPQILYCHTCGRVISSGRGTKGLTVAALDPTPETDLYTSKGRGKGAHAKSKQKKASDQVPRARKSAPKRCSERCRRAKPGAVERLVEGVFVAVLDGRLPSIRDGRNEAEIGGGSDVGNETVAERDSTRRTARSGRTRNGQLGVEPRTEAVSENPTIDNGSSSDDDDDEGGVKITVDNDNDQDSDDENDGDNDNDNDDDDNNQLATNSLPSQNGKTSKQQPDPPSADPTWDSSLRSRAQTLIDSKKLHLDGTKNNSSNSSSNSSSKNKRKKGDSRITVRCSEVLACVFPDLVHDPRREWEGGDEDARDDSGTGFGDGQTEGLAQGIEGSDASKQRQGMQRARTLEMVKQAARRLVVFGYLDGNDDDQRDGDNEDDNEYGDISMQQQEREGGRRRFCEALSGPTSVVVEPSFAKGDWAVRWQDRRG